MDAIVDEINRLWIDSRGADRPTEAHVPPEVLQDIREGLADESYLDPYRVHIEECGICQRARVRSLDSAFDVFHYMAATGIPPHEVGRRDFHSRLLKRATENAHSLSIIAGEASAEIWNSTTRVAFEKFLASGGRVQIIVGPVLATDDNGEHVLLQLCQKEGFELFVSERRQPVHFWVADAGKMIYVEEPHTPLATKRVAYMTRADAWVTNYFFARFAYALRSPIVRRFESGGCLERVRYKQMEELKRQVLNHRASAPRLSSGTEVIPNGQAAQLTDKQVIQIYNSVGVRDFAQIIDESEAIDAFTPATRESCVA